MGQEDGLNYHQEKPQPNRGLQSTRNRPKNEQVLAKRPPATTLQRQVGQFHSARVDVEDENLFFSPVLHFVRVCESGRGLCSQRCKENWRKFTRKQQNILLHISTCGRESDHQQRGTIIIIIYLDKGLRDTERENY